MFNLDNPTRVDFAQVLGSCGILPRPKQASKVKARCKGQKPMSKQLACHNFDLDQAAPMSYKWLGNSALFNASNALLLGYIQQGYTDSRWNVTINCFKMSDKFMQSHPGTIQWKTMQWKNNSRFKGFHSCFCEGGLFYVCLLLVIISVPRKKTC